MDSGTLGTTVPAIAVLALVISANRTTIANGVLTGLSIAVIANDSPRWIFAGRHDDWIMAGARTVDWVAYDRIMARAGSMHWLCNGRSDASEYQWRDQTADNETQGYLRHGIRRHVRLPLFSVAR
jgi:hypothetical protein